MMNEKTMFEELRELSTIGKIKLAGEVVLVTLFMIVGMSSLMLIFA